LAKWWQVTSGREDDWLRGIDWEGGDWLRGVDWEGGDWMKGAGVWKMLTEITQSFTGFFSAFSAVSFSLVRSMALICSMLKTFSSSMYITCIWPHIKQMLPHTHNNDNNRKMVQKVI
jgi:hypothetical protein